jgi:predicted aspartyl protease
MMEMRALTLKSNGGRLKVIESIVGISVPFIGEMQTKDVIKPFKGIWDSGATNSVITKKVVDELGLKPIGQKEVNSATETVVANTYLVNFILPSNVVITNVLVTELNLNSCDVLIGMDVITLGDFSITNKDGRTVMSFRMPSCVEHDYVSEANTHNRIQQFKLQRTPKSKATQKKKSR